MNKPVFAVTALLVAGLALALAADEDEWAAKLFPKGLSHDFGKVERDANHKYSFPMKNIYKVPVEITNLRSSCGCLTCKASKKKLQPGEAASLDVVLDARRFSGPKNMTIYMTVGPQYVSTATLRVTAHSK